MKILFLAPFYLGLYKVILSELERKGNEVTVLEDVMIPGAGWYYKRGAFSRFIQFLKNKFKINEYIRRKYWRDMIRERTDVNGYYDFFLCINGSSFHPTLMNVLKSFNPNIKSSLYIWDSNSYCDFFHSVPFFDKAFSFDWNDCQSNKKIEYLPFYWVPNKTSQNDKVLKYDISIIGTNHDDRAKIVSKIKNLLDNESNISYFFKIYLPPSNISIKEHLKYCLYKYLKYNKNYDEYNYLLNRYKNEKFLTEIILQPQEVTEIIKQSRCILDTDRECQRGTTPRVIWALANGKKIITTNKFIENLPFYNPRQIKIIDRENPVIDIEFLKQNEVFEISPYVESLRIDKWVATIMPF